MRLKRQRRKRWIERKKKAAHLAAKARPAAPTPATAAPTAAAPAAAPAAAKT